MYSAINGLFRRYKYSGAEFRHLFLKICNRYQNRTCFKTIQ